MIIDELKSKNLITKTGTINSSVIRRDWFTTDDIFQKIKQETSWMNSLNPTIGIRIKAILLNEQTIKYCACGTPCTFCNKKHKLFKKTCGKKACVTEKAKYIRTDDLKKKLSTTKKTSRKNMLNVFLQNMTNQNPCMPVDELKVFIAERFKSNNKVLVAPEDYRSNSTILYSIIRQTKHIEFDPKHPKWSQRMYDILNDIHIQKKCNCGEPVGYNGRIVGYSSMCHICFIKRAPDIRVENQVENVKRQLPNDYEIVHCNGLSRGKTTIKHNVCGTIFSKWCNNARWKNINCPTCNAHTSNIEKDILNFVLSFTTAEKIKIDNKEIDIFSKEYNIGIEVNGVYWHSEDNGKYRKYHLNKTNLAKSHNIKLIQIYEDEIEDKLPIVKARLKSIFGQTKYRLYGRKCSISEINTKTKNAFLNKYHIQGEDKSTIKLGAFYKNRLIAVMTFGPRRFDKKQGYELMRFATISSFNCIGVAGKLLRHFETHHTPQSIISYADKRWSGGNLYFKLGFKHTYDSPPNYFYINKKNGARESRHKYQKHKLKNILSNFDPNISEWKNMKINGFNRIWDCGNMVFEKSYETNSRK